MWNVEELELLEPCEEEYYEESNKEFITDVYKKYFSDQFMVRYIRKPDRTKKGVLIAVKTDNNKVIIGWSLCCSKDKFDKSFGQDVAINRGIKHYDNPDYYEDIPFSIISDMDMFIDRCTRYYKDGVFPLWV